jgi:site-specific DNA-methyltransferase (adenine-specific)
MISEMRMADNILYYGDNLDILHYHVRGESVDLVYLDPPFNSNASYNVLFAAQDGTRSAAQIKAFGDTWRWDQAAAHDYQETVEAGGQVSQAMQAFHTLLGPSNMLAYLAMMAPRLKELRRALKPTGPLYLHLRSDREPLPEAATRCSIRPSTLPVGDHLEADDRA